MLSCSRKPLLSAASLGLAALCLLGTHSVSAQTAVLTQNNDNARTGANTAETILTPSNVNTASFGKLFTITGLNANVNGQVLYVPSVSIGGVLHNVVYAYTSNNSDNSPCGLFAYDADTGAQLWQTILPNSATYTTAAPVIDPATNTLYVLTKTGTDNTGATYLRVVDITTGKEKTTTPTQVTASANGTGDGAVNGKVYFDGPAANGYRFHANDRPALLLANGNVYLGFAHNSDSFPYHGWILSYHFDGTNVTQVASFCTTPNGGDGGIWQSGKGLASDAAGNIYFSIGNGTFDANTGGSDYGMCYMKLSPTLKVLSYFAPHDELTLSNQDLDLGNSGIAGIPGTTALFGGGTKFGSAFLMNSASLGGFSSTTDNVLARIDSVSGNDDVGQNPISWDNGTYKYVYLWPGGQPLEQFKYDPSVGNLSPKGIFATASSAVTDGGSLGISSNGISNGILWAIGGDGTVRAYDATNVANAELWDSKQNSARDGIGGPGHFQFPTIVNGKVYVPTGNTIAVYGLLTAAASSSLVNDTDPGLIYNNGDWFYNSGRGVGDLGNDVHATQNNGDAVSYLFTGTGISYLTETYSDEGHVQIYLDGVLQSTVSCVTATRKTQQTVWSKTGLADVAHTLKLVKQDGQFMVVDGLQVTPASLTTANDTNPNIVYSGSSWFYNSGRGVGDFGDDVHATENNGDAASYTFTGTSVSYQTETNPDEGTVAVYIDGVLKQTVSCVTPQRQVRQTVFTLSGLAPGSHTIKLVKTGGMFLVVDGFTTE